MKVMIIILSLLIISAGIIPFLGEGSLGILPSSIPTTGFGYSLIVIVVGAIGLVYGFVNRMIMGLERVVTIFIAILTILGGILPLFATVFPGLPTSGALYSGMIIIIGLIGFVYGVMGLG